MRGIGEVKTLFYTSKQSKKQAVMLNPNWKILLTSNKDPLNFTLEMKRVIFYLMVALGCLANFSSYAQDKLAVKRIEPGRWAFSFKAVGNIPVNSPIHNRFKSGLGVGARAGYGFWQGLSVEGDFQYDLLFREGGPADDEEDKNLFSLASGLRYTFSLLRDDIGAYLYFVPGITFDYTKGANNNFELSYAVGTGMDFNLTERLSVGPLTQFRHIFEDSDIDLVSVGAAFTYIFD